MKKTIIPFSLLSQLAKTDIAYASGDPALRPFYRHTPNLAQFEAIFQEKAGQKFPRKDLVDTLQTQYQNLPQKPQVNDHISALLQENTYTITTAHQPTFLTGPLYFIYKALTTIKLAEAVQAQSGGKYQVVPVFVLGAEDHDLEELNKATVFGKKLVWEPGETGAVGNMNSASTAPALQELKEILGDNPAANALFQRVEQAYSGATNFADATQALLHELLGDMGLVVLIMGTPQLKRHFIPVMREELLEQPSAKLLNETIEALNTAGFKTQASPREINLFYLMPGLRERIVFEDDVYKVLHTDYVFSKTAILEELESHPERFSPNVVLRPLFQETILPNLAYVGGGGELAYWLERKAQFEYFNLPFPMLVRRHSVLWLDKDVEKKLEKLGFQATDLFEDSDALVRAYVERNAAVEISFATEKQELQQLYERLAQKAGVIDPTLETALKAESVKAVSGLEQWESRLMRAEKQKHEVAINQLRNLKDKLFPNNGLQERSDNILPFLLKYGNQFLIDLKEAFEPFDDGFLVLQGE